MRTVVEDLRAARELIAQGWCQGTLAETQHGDSILPTHSSARRFCALGALVRVCGTERWREVTPYRTRLQRLIRRDVTVWNDRKGRTRADILALYDRAIAAEERK